MRQLAAPVARLARPVITSAVAIVFAVLATADALPSQQPDAQLLEAGKAVYVDQCESCHGAEGRGDGPASRFLSPKARDLTLGEWQHAEDGSVAAVATVIRDGIEATGMTPFAAQLSDDEIDAVAAYVVHVLVAGGN